MKRRIAVAKSVASRNVKVSAKKSTESSKRKTTFPSRDTKMGRLIGDLDWSKTSIGPIENWSQSLRTTVSLVLSNRFPMLLWWGKDYICIYNDAYIPILGAKHPWGLGKPVRVCWSEIWSTLKPLIDRPFNGGEATWLDDLTLEITRHGFPEETHFTVAYSPVPDDEAPNNIGGVLATVTETTDKVVGERRLNLLRDLGAVVTDSKTKEDVCAIIAKVVGNSPYDVPFSMFYLADEQRKNLQLISSAGIRVGEAISPVIVGLDKERGQLLPYTKVFQGGRMEVVGNLSRKFKYIPDYPWSDPAHTVAVIPIPSTKRENNVGVIVAGISSRLPLNTSYKSFFELLASQVAGVIANATALEEERKRIQALEQIDKAKTVFFSNISHEFRTPLTLMLSPLEEFLAQKGSKLRPAEKENLETTHRNALRLLKLVNSLLDFSRIESGRQQANYVRVDIAELTKNLVANFRSVIEKAGLKLTVKTSPVKQAVFVDTQMWEKIVFNLLSNAFKYTLSGSIKVELKEDDGSVKLMVKDTGVGIPEHELPNLFKRFHRIQHMGGRTFEGTGIGLSLTKELVNLHKGEIIVESTLNKGTTFTINIPTGKKHLSNTLISTVSHRNGQTEANGNVHDTFIDEAETLLEASSRVSRRASSGHAITVMATDITEETIARRKVEKSEKELRELANAMPQLVWIADSRGNITYFNDRIHEFSGVSRKADGTWAWEGVVHEEDFEGTRQAWENALKQGTGFEQENRMRMKDGTYKWYLSRGYPQKNENGEVICWYGTSTYIHDQKMFEEILEQKVVERTEEVRQSNLELERMNKELESFSYVASHDLQEPLRKIQTFSARIAEKETLTDSGKDYFKRIQSAANRMQKLIQDLLAFSRVTTGEQNFERVRLADIVDDVVKEYSDKLQEKNATVETRELGEVYAIAFQFRQLMLNLISNSIKFSRPDLPLKIIVESKTEMGSEIVASNARIHHRLVPDTLYFHITFADNGIGFEPQFNERVFEVFQRLHGNDKYSGTGIGLSIVKKIVENHNGVIAASGELNNGARFDIYIPSRK